MLKIFSNLFRCNVTWIYIIDLNKYALFGHSVVTKDSYFVTSEFLYEWHNFCHIVCLIVVPRFPFF